MHTRHPVWTLVGTISSFAFFTTVIPLFFGTTWIGLTHLLSEIGKITPTSRSFKISFLTTSFIAGLSLLCASLCGFTSSSINILCMHIAGLIPLMSAILHPMASLYFFNTCVSFPSSSSDKSAAIITGSVSASPKKMYFKCSGSGFNSNFGASMIEGRSLDVDAGKLSNLGRYILE